LYHSDRTETFLAQSGTFPNPSETFSLSEQSELFLNPSTPSFLGDSVHLV
jgi:hypothetical protein